MRRDLLAQLSALLVRVPPLREYAEDVPDLLRFYVERMVESEKLPLRRFSVAAQNRLRNYPWPDNLRELRSLVRRMLVRGGPEEIRLEEIERELAAQAPADVPLVKQDLLALPLREAREQFERAYLQQQLLLCNGKVGQLAKRVGMERTHLYRKTPTIRAEPHAASYRRRRRQDKVKLANTSARLNRYSPIRFRRTSSGATSKRCCWTWARK